MTAKAKKPKKQRRVPDARMGRASAAINAVIQVVLVLVLFGLANHLSGRHYRRWDLSENRMYSLSGMTRNLLDSLRKQDSRVKLVVVFVQGSRFYEDIRAIIGEYQHYGKPAVDVEIFDPARRPDHAEEIKNRYNLLLNRNLVIVDVDDRVTVVTEDEMYSKEGGKLGIAAEEALTAALVKAHEGEVRKLYVLRGHGVPEAYRGATAYDVLNQHLKQQNAVLSGLNLAELDAVPSDAEGIIVLAPTSDLSRDEMRVLRQYWESERGALLVLLDPAAETPNLHAFLRKYGIAPRGDRVVTARRVRDSLQIRFEVAATFLDDTPVTRDLKGNNTYFPGQSQSLRLFLDDELLKEEQIVLRPMISATSNYWGETKWKNASEDGVEFNHGEDFDPPLYLAAVVEKGAHPDPKLKVESSRMVVVSNPSLLFPRNLLRQNLDFIMSSINWLLDRDALIGISPKDPAFFATKLTEVKQDQLQNIVLFGLPGAMFLLGIFLWAGRRR